MKNFESLISDINNSLCIYSDEDVSSGLCSFYINKNDDNALLDVVLNKLKLIKNVHYTETNDMWQYKLLSHIMKIKFGDNDGLVKGKAFMKKLLMEKNKKYGNAVLNPFCFFSNKNIKHTIYSRLDEKLSRLINNIDGDDEDIFVDIMGYLYFAIIAEENDL